MTKVKLCGISRMSDIEIVNELHPEYIGFVFAKKSKRFVTPEKAAELRSKLCEDIQSVGVFVDEPVEMVAKLLNENTIQIAQLHGSEDEEYIDRLRQLCKQPIIKAYRVEGAEDIADIETCTADYVLLDSGAGSGEIFDWNLIQAIRRPFFLAGGLTVENVETAITKLHPFAVDVSSGIETDGQKDKEKMTAFVEAVRKLK